jgi:hypothetical protein
VRIRRFRSSDAEALLAIEQHAAQAEARPQPDTPAFLQQFADPTLDVVDNLFVITDDDDDLQVWGQAETLEGLEGEIAGYMLVQEQHTPDYYRFLAQGAVDPVYTDPQATRILLIGSLNRARHLAAEFEFEAEAAGKPIYFDAFLPRDSASVPELARKLELSLVPEPAPPGFLLYRLQL